MVIHKRADCESVPLVFTVLYSTAIGGEQFTTVLYRCTYSTYLSTAHIYAGANLTKLSSMLEKAARGCKLRKNTEARTPRNLIISCNLCMTLPPQGFNRWPHHITVYLTIQYSTPDSSRCTVSSRTLYVGVLLGLQYI